MSQVEESEKETTPQKETVHEEVRYPWVQLSMSRRVITLLLISSLLLTVASITLAVSSVRLLNRKPWVVGYQGGTYNELNPQRFRVTRDDVEIFLSSVIPQLYGSVNGEAPGLELLRTVVNPNIISNQKENLQEQYSILSQGVSQFAIVTGINPDTLVINRTEKFIYAEAIGVTTFARRDKSIPSQTQWRCLIYILEPVSSLETNTPGGRVAGNEYGLYLQQIVEQAPGTVNPDSPQPTTQDEQEKREQQLRRQREQNQLPEMNLNQPDTIPQGQ